MNGIRLKNRTLFIPLAVTILVMAGCSSDSPTSSAPEPTDPYSVILTIAGTGTAGLGADGGAPTEVHFYLPQDLTFGPDGIPYILDWNNHRVRILKDNKVTTVIGTGMLGDAPAGLAREVSLNHPTHISFDPLGRLILSAWHNSMVMRMDLGTTFIQPICGDGRRSFGGDGGPAGQAILDLPSSTAFDSKGQMYISDQANQRIRLVDVNGVITTAVGTGQAGFAGDGGPASEAKISLPGSQSAPPVGRIFVDDQDNLYISDTVNNRIRKVDANGVITTVAGSNRQGFDGDGGLATEAALNWPSDVAIGPDGNLYIADTRNSVIRMVDQNGIITTFAGKGREPGYEGDGGLPAEAKLNRPYGITFDARGNFYIADTHNHVVRMIPN